MENKIPTAEEIASGFYTKYTKEEIALNGSLYSSTVYHERLTEAIRDFAKLHVQAALKEASKQAKIEEDSILNAYPLENIK